MEKELSPLRRQHKSNHRYLHPTMNFWPEIEEHNPTTCIPYLNWYVSSASKVSELILEKWKKEEQPIKEFHKVTRVSPLSNGALRSVQVEFEAYEEKKEPEKFDYVICCAGFGDDQTIIYNNKGYWEYDDNFEQSVQFSVAKGEKVGISGVGDGGIIEALERFCMSGEFGKKIIEIFACLKNDGNLRRDVIEAEKNQVLSEKKRIYEEIVNRKLPILARQILEDAFKQTQSGRGGNIVLFGHSLEHPTMGSAAPIHKILITYALENGMQYVNLTDKITKENIDEFKNTHNLRYLILRHGSIPPLENFISESDGFDKNTFKKLQEVLEFSMFENIQIPKETGLKNHVETFLVNALKYSKDKFIVDNNKVIFDKEYLTDENRQLPLDMGCCPGKVEGYKIYGYPIFMSDKEEARVY